MTRSRTTRRGSECRSGTRNAGSDPTSPMSRPTTRRIATRRLLIAAALLVLAVVTGTASAGRGDPQKHLTAADNARARSMLLRRADLGPRLHASRQSSAGRDAYCKALDESDLTLTGEAKSPTLQLGARFVGLVGAGVSSRSADANASWRRGYERRRHDVSRGTPATRVRRSRASRLVVIPRIAVPARRRSGRPPTGIERALVNAGARSGVSSIDLVPHGSRRAQVALFFGSACSAILDAPSR